MTNLNSLQKCNYFEPSLHNGVKCIQSTRPEDQGTEHQFWFTRQMLREIFDVKSDITIANHVEALVKRGVVNELKNLSSLNIKNENGNGSVKTTLYDIKVFNHLAMRLDTDRAWEEKEKFNDILVKEETKQTTLPAVSKEDQFFLNIIHADSKEGTALALNEYKIFRDEREQKIAFERDEAVRTKAYISQKREATLMGKVGGTTKALNVEREKNTKLLKENIDLIKEKEDLKIRLQESDNYKTIRQMTVHLKKYIKTDTKSLQRLGKEMARISLELSFKVIKVPDPLYEEVNSYHTEVWRETFAKLNNDPLFLIDIRK